MIDSIENNIEKLKELNPKALMLLNPHLLSLKKHAPNEVKPVFRDSEYKVLKNILDTDERLHKKLQKVDFYKKFPLQSESLTYFD